MSSARSPKPLAAKLFASISVLGAAASCSGLMTFADAVAAPATLRIDTGPRPRVVALGRSVRSATNVAPGDRIDRTLVLEARGRRIGRLRLNVRARPRSILTQHTLGLRLAIERCSRQWRRKGWRYTCRGRTKTVLRLSPVLGRHRLRHVATRRGERLFLLLTLTLPASADNTFQHQRTKLVYTFTRR